MNQLHLSIEPFLSKVNLAQLIDIRPKKAFQKGHIPGAISIPFPIILQKPLHSNTPQKAIQQLVEYKQRLKRITSKKRLLIYCQNGKSTSNTCTMTLNSIGIFPHTLRGGYQAFQAFRDLFFQKRFPFIVIRGLTGSGKTRLLFKLEAMGHQCLHLENLAKHRGSVFGQYPDKKQPNNEQFANDIFQVLSSTDIKQPIYVEYKGAFIGKVQIPKPLFDKMQQPFQTFFLDVPREIRMQNILTSYGNLPTTTLLQAIQKLESRLSKKEFVQCQKLASERNLLALVDKLLNYYDQGKEYQIPPGVKVLRPFLKRRSYL